MLQAIDRWRVVNGKTSSKLNAPETINLMNKQNSGHFCTDWQMKSDLLPITSHLRSPKFQQIINNYYNHFWFKCQGSYYWFHLFPRMEDNLLDTSCVFSAYTRGFMAQYLFFSALIQFSQFFPDFQLFYHYNYSREVRRHRAIHLDPDLIINTFIHRIWHIWNNN
jgi:hypothetical protein